MVTIRHELRTIKNHHYYHHKTYTCSQPTTGLNLGKAWCCDFSKPTSLIKRKSSTWTENIFKVFGIKDTKLDYQHGPFIFNLTTTPYSSSFSLPSISFTDFCSDNKSELNQPSPKSTHIALDRCKSLPVLSSSNSLHTKLRERPSLQFTGIELKDRHCEYHVLSNSTAFKLVSFLPARMRLNSNWKLKYSIDQHGSSINTLFRNTRNSGPCVLAIRTSNNQIFGAYLSDPLQSSPSYYGNGECFLWRDSNNKLEIFNATGLNHYFINCEPTYISLGGGDGKYGLWLNNDLERGISMTCDTFNNAPLDESPDFCCVDLEIWEVAPNNMDTS